MDYPKGSLSLLEKRKPRNPMRVQGSTSLVPVSLGTDRRKLLNGCERTWEMRVCIHEQSERMSVRDWK